MNEVMMVGRIEKSPIMNEKEDCVEFTLKVSRTYQNENGEYEVDFIPIKVFDSMKQNVLDDCKENDVVGVKGRLSRLKDENLEVVAKKISYLARSNQNENI